MKKLIVIAASLLLVCSAANAQGGMLGRIGQRAKNALENSIGNKVENAIEGAIDKATTRHDNDENDEPATRSKSQNKGSNDAEGWTCPECGATGNTGRFCDDCGAKKPEGADAAPADTPDASIGTVDSDFVQGAVVLFEDNFAGEKIGEFPSRWDFDGGQIEIATIGDRKVAKFYDYGKIFPLMEKDQYNYLPDIFTIEWDMYISKPSGDFDDMNFSLNLMNRERGINTHNRSCAYVDVWWRPGDESSRVYSHVQKPDEGEVNSDVSGAKTNIKPGGFNHFAVSFNRRAFKVYVNGVRIANFPNMLAPTYVEVSFGNSDGYPYCCISNFRIGAGAVELYERNASTIDPSSAAAAVEKAMQESGKFVTNNILFETGKATLKPESMADITAVADYMKANPSVRFEVQGHCDNQGSDAVNDPLSQQRAEAIVAELAKLGVDEWNLRAVGKGSHEPVADNSTEEGRAKNRRVEFIRK